MLVLRPCLRAKSFNPVSRALPPPSRFFTNKVQVASSRVLGEDASGRGVWFQLGRLGDLKIIVIVLFQIRPKRKHLCWVRQVCKGQKVLSRDWNSGAFDVCYFMCENPKQAEEWTSLKETHSRCSGLTALSKLLTFQRLKGRIRVGVG